MNGGYIYGDADMFGAIIDAISKSESTATYKNAFYEAKRLADSKKPIYFKHGDIISTVLSVGSNAFTISMYILVGTIKSLSFNPSNPDTISIN